MSEHDADLVDVVVVGAGVAGAVLAKHLTERGLRVLVLEAGDGSAQSLDGYERHLRTYYEAAGKGPESAWPPNPNAPQPDTGDLEHRTGYFVQRGPHLYGSSYTRLQGGSTLHWLGVSLRMLPQDFDMRTNFGVGRDWPIGYDDLEPHYRAAELDLGVSADVADQAYQGITFPDGYDYAMQRVPPSYSDRWLASRIDGLDVPIGDGSASVVIRNYPAARNSMPRNGFEPVGALDRRDDGVVAVPNLGERCQGNSSCTPICPVQAKYSANRTLLQIDPRRMEIRARAVVTRIDTEPESGDVSSVTYRRWGDTGPTEHRAVGRAYVLAAHAVENAKVMLNSGLDGADQVGRNLMDHPALYAYGLSPEPVWQFRGPPSTAGVEDFRSGGFRSEFAAFRFDVGNDGWRGPTGAPDSNVHDAAHREGLYGSELRRSLRSTLTRQVRFSLAIEQLPDPDNRVTLDPDHRDPLGIPRPAIDYRIDDYTLAGMVEATRVAQAIFRHAGIEDFSDTDTGRFFPSATYGDRVFAYHGMGHFAGTHIMGDDPTTSVVDHTQRSWDHDNLYLIGSGSFPTMGTSNPTLTIAAMAARTADHLATKLGA